MAVVVLCHQRHQYKCHIGNQLIAHGFGHPSEQHVSVLAVAKPAAFLIATHDIHVEAGCCMAAHGVTLGLHEKGLLNSTYVTTIA